MQTLHHGLYGLMPSQPLLHPPTPAPTAPPPAPHAPEPDCMEEPGEVVVPAVLDAVGGLGVVEGCEAHI
jgi:hypothetical protein